MQRSPSQHFLQSDSEDDKDVNFTQEAELQGCTENNEHPLCQNEESLFHIFSFLNNLELARAGAVCKTFYRLSQDEVLQKQARKHPLDYRQPLAKKKIAPCDITSIELLTDSLVAGATTGCLPSEVNAQTKLIKIWNLKNGKEVKTLEGFTSPITCIKRLTDNQIVVGEKNGKISIIDYLTGEKIKNFNIHTDAITSIAVSSSTKFVTSSRDRTLCILDLKKNTQTLLPGHDFVTTHLAILNDHLLTSGLDRILRVWNIYNGELLDENNLEETLNSIHVFSNEKIITFTDRKFIICKLNAIGQTIEIDRYPLAMQITSIAPLPNDTIAVGTKTGSIFIINSNNNSKESTKEDFHFIDRTNFKTRILPDSLTVDDTQAITDIKILPNGNMVICAGGLYLQTFRFAPLKSTKLTENTPEPKEEKQTFRP